MGKMLAIPQEDLLVMSLALLIVFGPAILRLLAATLAYRTSGRLYEASRNLAQLINEAEARRKDLEMEIEAVRTKRRERSKFGSERNRPR